MSEVRLVASVRLAHPQDEDAIFRLWLDLVAYHKSLERIRPQRWSGSAEDVLRPLLAAVWANPEREAILVACEGEEIAGFVRAAVAENGPCPGRIETLYVAEGRRGGRIGRELVGRAVGWLSERGAVEVAVDFIAPNAGARRFYERFGFEPLLVTYMRRAPRPEGP